MTTTTPGPGSEPDSNKTPTPEEVTASVAFVDGVLGSSGKSVDDPATREIIRRQAADEITGDEARALFRKQQGLD